MLAKERIPMNIAIVCPEGLPIPPSMGGSVQIYVHAFVKRLSRTTALTLISPGTAPLHWNNVNHSIIKQGTSPYLTKVLRKLAELKPDIVQIENRPSWVPLVRKRLPHANIILNLHSLTFLGPTHISPPLARRVLRQANAVVVNSHYLGRAIQQKFRLKTTDWHCKVIHPGVDLTFFAPSSPVSPATLTIRPMKVLFVGRVIQQKGVHVLVRAVRLLKQGGHEVELTIIGKTPPWERKYGQRVRKMAKGLPVTFRGFVHREDLPAAFHQAHVVVCPSQSSEAFGLVNAEALAAGIPVIGSRLGGIPEIVNPHCGILVDAYRQPSAFAAAIQSIMDHPETYTSLRNGTKKYAARFSWSRTARKFHELYQTLNG